MPKISAPTVAEHRAAQRESIIEAAKALLTEQGLAAVTPRAVGERTGLARSSFYEYFPSRDDLLAAIALEAFTAWSAEIEAVMADRAPGRDRVHAYVEASIRMAADGKHALATQLQQAELAPKSLDTIMAMHDTLASPLRTALEEWGVPDASTRAALVQGVITAGMQLVAHGVPPEGVIASTTALLDGGIEG